MANKKGGKRPRSAGKGAVQTRAYYESGRLQRKKLRNVIVHGGFRAGVSWAKAHGCEDILASFGKAKNNFGQPLRWLERARNRDRVREMILDLRQNATDQQKVSARTLLATT